MSSWNLTVDGEGVAKLTLDTPETKLNILGQEVFRELNTLLDEIRSRKDINGMILVSGKAESFVAGANIEEFLELKTAQEAAEASRQAQSVFQKLEDLPFPTVAAIHGICVGGGLELVLACTARVSSDSPKTSFAAPEVQLGIIPGAGGTQRLPRTVGLMNALGLNMTGRSLRPQQAAKMGLVSAVAPKEALERAAREELKRLWRGEPPRRRPLTERIKSLLLEGNPMGRAMLYRGAEKELAKTGGHYPAPRAALEAMRAGVEEGREAGFRAESRLFGEMAVTEISRQLIRLFFAVNDLKKETGTDVPDVQPAKVDRLLVLGSGFMGSGIAQVAAEKVKVPVRMYDTKPDMLGRALKACREAFDEKVKRKRMTRQDFQQTMDRLTATTSRDGFGSCDLVIEAVFEDLAVKHEVLRETEKLLPDRAIFASNTSSIPIGKIAEASTRPERVVGMHFFSPVPKMPLLEVIVTDKTHAGVTATAVEFGKRMGKTVIVVRDKCGFYTSRALCFYINEAALMVEEGGDIAEIDRAMTRFGFPVGPFVLMDEVGLDIGAHVTRVMGAEYGDRLKVASSIKKVVDEGRLGKKNKKGFYKYDGKKGGQKPVDESVYRLLPGGMERKMLGETAIQRRLWLTLAIECARCLEEGVLMNPRDGDVGAIMGLGFPPFRGGPFRMMDHEGIDRIVSEMKELAARHGARLAAPAILTDLAARKATFFGGKDRWETPAKADVAPPPAEEAGGREQAAAAAG